MGLLLQSALDQPQQQSQQGGIDPSLLAQIMALGSVDQRHRLLQQQMDMAGQTAQGSTVDYSHGKGTPLLLAGLANMISSGVGGYQQGKAMAGQQGLIDQQNKGRGAFGQAWDAANRPVQAPPDSLAAPGFDAASQEQQRQGSLSSLRNMAMLSGDSTLSGAVKAGPQMALEDQRLASGNIGMEQERQKVAAGQRLAESETDPATTLLRRALAKKYAPDQAQAIDSAPGGAINAVLSNLEKFSATQETANARRESAREYAASRADVARIMAAGGNTRAAITATGAVPGAPGASAQPVDPNALEPLPPAGKLADHYTKLAEKFQKDMDAASASSRTQFGQTANVVFRGSRNLALLNQKNPDGTQRQLTLPEWQEVSGGLMAMQTGGVPTERMMQEGLPRDIKGNVASIMSWLTSSPNAPDRQAWIDRFTSNVNREEDTAKKTQREAQLSRLPSNSEFFSRYPNRAKLAAGGFGIGPEMVDLVRSGQQPTAAPSAAPAATRKSVGGKTYEQRPDGWYEVQ